MTTREFIARNFGVPQDKVRWCSSVCVDERGYIYSYGAHYPLAFSIAGLTFINTQGYSNTTARHISWAMQEIDAIQVKLDRDSAIIVSGSYYNAKEKIDKILRCLHIELGRVQDVMSTKKRKDTFVYQDLLAQEERLTTAIQAVRGTL